MTIGILLTLLLSSGCAAGVITRDAMVGVAIGDAKIVNDKDCRCIDGGKISKNGSEFLSNVVSTAFDKVFGWLPINSKETD